MLRSATCSVDNSRKRGNGINKANALRHLTPQINAVIELIASLIDLAVRKLYRLQTVRADVTNLPD